VNYRRKSFLRGSQGGSGGAWKNKKEMVARNISLFTILNGPEKTCIISVGGGTICDEEITNGRRRRLLRTTTLPLEGPGNKIYILK